MEIKHVFVKPSDGTERMPRFFEVGVERWLVERQGEIRRMFHLVLVHRQREQGNKPISEEQREAFWAAVEESGVDVTTLMPR